MSSPSVAGVRSVLAGQVDACRQMGDHGGVARGEDVLCGFDLAVALIDGLDADAWTAAFTEANPTPEAVAELFGANTGGGW